MYNSRIKSPHIDDLFTAILSLEDIDECYRFFEDAITIPEIQTFARRWQVARMLDQNETYAAISDETGVSATTISRVKNSLLYGAGGYRLALDRTKED